jgi:hypothetical protein
MSAAMAGAAILSATKPIAAVENFLMVSSPFLLFRSNSLSRPEMSTHADQVHKVRECEELYAGRSPEARIKMATPKRHLYAL